MENEMDRAITELQDTLRRVMKDLIDRGQIDNPTDWARRAGVAEGTVREFLSGRTRTLTLERYILLAKAVGLPVSALIGDDVPRDKKERRILKAYREAPPQGRAVLDALADRELDDSDQ